MLTRSHVLAAACLAALGVVGSACSSSSPPPPPPAPTDPSQLSPPPSGQGVQMMTDAFPIPAGTEIQACYFFKVSDLATAAGVDPTQPLQVHRVQLVQKAGSHHMNLFRVRTIVGLDPAKGAVQVGTNGQGQCFVSSNWADWPLIANTQQEGDQDWSYPDGVANELDPNETLMLQTHYVNAQTQGTPDGVGQVGINLWTMDPGQVTAQLGTVFATNQNIRVCQHNKTPSYSASCQFNSPQPVTVVGANGHFHSRGKEFDIFAWDGTTTTTPDPSQRFYKSTQWDEPPMLHSPDLEEAIVAKGGFWWTCSYQWIDPAALTNNEVTCDTLNQIDATKYHTPQGQLDCCYTFGGVVEKNEHCNAFVYYYPKQDNVNCF